jgi:hypothetical protein
MYRILCLACSLAYSIALTPVSARAEDTLRASMAFDAGVAAYEAGDYRAAAQAFLQADLSAPNPVALGNAVAAAERLAPGPLPASVAAHALAQAGIPEALRRRAAALQLASPPHEALALRGGVEPSAGERPVERAAPGPVQEPLTPSMQSAPPRRDTRKGRSPLPGRVFFGASSVVALTLVGLGSYTGIAALHARDERDSRPESYDPDDVRRLARRADFLLGAGLVCASAALISGLVWVDWGHGHGSVVTAAAGGGALVRHSVTF